MKPAESKLRDTLERSAVEAVARKAARAAAPDYYVQKATGRALTKLVVFVGGLQVGGVFLWLALVFAGVVDASMNLDAFMVSQLVVFIGSLVVGMAWTIRHLKKLQQRADSWEPGIAAPMLELLGIEVDAEGDSQVSQWFEDHQGVDRVVNGARPECVFSGRSGDHRFCVMDVHGDEQSRGLVLACDDRGVSESPIVVEPASDERAGPTLDTDGELAALADLPDQVDDNLLVYAADADEARRLLSNSELTGAINAFASEAQRRDRLVDDGGEAGDFSVLFDPEMLLVVRRGAEALFPAAEEADDATVDELVAAAREVRAAADVVEAVDQTAD